VAGPRAEKIAVVEEVRGHLEQADAAILTEYRGLKVTDLATLRRALRAAGAEYKIYKNTLVKRATADTRHAVIGTLLEGPTAIAFVEHDVAAAAKVLREFAKTHPALVVKGSFIGSGLLDARTTNALADLPSREVLLAQIAGALAAPLRQFASLLKALPQNLAYGLSALIDQRVAGVELLPAVADVAPAEQAAPAEVAAEEAPAEEAAPAEAAAEAPAEAGAAAADEAAPAEAAVVEGRTDEAAADVSASGDADDAEGEVSSPEASSEASAAAEAEGEVSSPEALSVAPPAGDAEESDTTDESAE